MQIPALFTKVERGIKKDLTPEINKLKRDIAALKSQNNKLLEELKKKNQTRDDERSSAAAASKKYNDKISERNENFNKQEQQRELIKKSIGGIKADNQKLNKDITTYNDLIASLRKGNSTRTSSNVENVIDNPNIPKILQQYFDTNISCKCRE